MGGEAPHGWDLVTSDLGLDFGADPAGHEAGLLAPMLAAAAVAMGAGRPGGAAVLKTFSWALPASRALYGLMTRAYDRVAIVKPRASRVYSLEVYLCGAGLREAPARAAARLLAGVVRRAPALASWPAAYDELVPPALDAALDRAADAVQARVLAAFEYNLEAARRWGGLGADGVRALNRRFAADAARWPAEVGL